jgi:hypothetical protein
VRATAALGLLLLAMSAPMARAAIPPFQGVGAAGVATFAGGVASTGWIDFDLFKDSQICIPVTLNGQPFTATLDNGASVSVVSSALVQALSLHVLGRVAVQGAHVDTRGVIADGMTLQVGALSVKDMTVGATDLSFFDKMGERPTPVILGVDLFNALVVDLDFPRRRMEFRDPEEFSPPVGAVAVDLKRELGRRSLAVSIENHAPISLLFDLGDTGAVKLYPDYISAQNLLAGRPTTTNIDYGVGGASTEIAGNLDQIKFGGLVFKNVVAGFWSSRPTDAIGGDMDGILGIQTLKQLHVIIDYPHDRLYILPSP